MDSRLCGAAQQFEGLAAGAACLYNASIPETALVAVAHRPKTDFSWMMSDFAERTAAPTGRGRPAHSASG